MELIQLDALDPERTKAPVTGGTQVLGATVALPPTAGPGETSLGGDENLRPSVVEGQGHGAWECHSCLRAFTLKMLGMIPRPAGTSS